MAYLLDTSTISFVLNGELGVARRYQEASLGNSVHSSVITEGELLFGALRVGRARQLELLGDISWFLSDLTSILPIDSEVAATWAELKRAAEKRGRPVASNDLWIAATAVYHDMTLVTHDRDFTSIEELKQEDWLA